MSDQDNSQFQTWFSETFGRDVTKEEAIEKQIALVSMIEVVFSPISEQDLVSIQEWRKHRK